MEHSVASCFVADISPKPQVESVVETKYKAITY